MSVFSQSASAHRADASSSEEEGDGECTLAAGERADEGGPQLLPALPFACVG